jgi:hypothetical protein
MSQLQNSVNWAIQANPKIYIKKKYIYIYIYIYQINRLSRHLTWMQDKAFLHNLESKVLLKLMHQSWTNKDRSLSAEKERHT